MEQFQINETMKIQMQDFQAKLNRDPNEKELGATADGKAKTLPISFVEMTLDEMFYGQWELSDVTTQQIFNEVVGTGILTVIHPITGRPLRRAGFGAVVITQDSGAKLADFNITKKKNALDLTFPKLKAEILKNAAQSLGKIFGRDINRKLVDSYKAPMTPMSDEAFAKLMERVEKEPHLRALAESNFLLTETQKIILESPKQIA